jgi:hypothetical protein
MARRLTHEQLLERAQKAGRIHWNRYVAREEQRHRQQRPATEQVEAVRRPQLTLIQGGAR